MKKTVLLLFLLFLAYSLSADAVKLDLEDAVQIGLENNSALKITQINYDAVQRNMESV